jgi:hypothetical protein
MLDMHQHEARFAAQPHARHQVYQLRPLSATLFADQFFVQKRNGLRAEVAVQVRHEGGEEGTKERAQQPFEMLVVARHAMTSSQTGRNDAAQAETESERIAPAPQQAVLPGDDVIHLKA